MAVVGVLAETDVGDDGRVGLGGDRAGGALDDTVVGPAPRPLGVFRLGDAEQDHGLDAGVGYLADAGNCLVDGDALVAGHRLDRDALVGCGVDEHRRDQVRRPERRLGDQVAQSVPSQASRTFGETHRSPVRTDRPITLLVSALEPLPPPAEKYKCGRELYNLVRYVPSITPPRYDYIDP